MTAENGIQFNSSLKTCTHWFCSPNGFDGEKNSHRNARQHQQNNGCGGFRLVWLVYIIVGEHAFFSMFDTFSMILKLYTKATVWMHKIMRFYSVWKQMSMLLFVRRIYHTNNTQRASQKQWAHSHSSAFLRFVCSSKWWACVCEGCDACDKDVKSIYGASAMMSKRMNAFDWAGHGCVSVAYGRWWWATCQRLSTAIYLR